MKHLAGVAAALLVLVSLIVAAEGPYIDPPAPPLAEAKVDVSRLKDWGRRCYAYTLADPNRAGQVEGTWEMSTKLDEGKVVLTDKIELAVRGQRWAWGATTECAADSTLSVRRVDAKGAGDDEAKTYNARVEGEKMVVAEGEKKREIPLPAHTLADVAAYRVVTLLPREASGRWAVSDWIELSELNVKRGIEIECKGAEGLTVGDKEIACTKYVVSQQGRKVLEAWVDEHGVAQRYQIDGRKRLDLVRRP